MTRGTLKVVAAALFLAGSADWAVLNLFVGPAAFSRPPSPSAIVPAPPPPQAASTSAPSAAPALSLSLDSASSAAPSTAAAPSASAPPAAAHEAWGEIRFSSGSTAVRPDALPALQSLAKRMKDDTSLRPRFEGHADDPGGKAANEFLALQRARLARAFIGSQGVDPGRVDVAGFGNTRKLDESGTPEATARNRRVEIHLK